MRVVISCCYQTAEENRTHCECRKAVATKRQRRTLQNGGVVKLLLPNCRGEIYRLGELLICCYQTVRRTVHTGTVVKLMLPKGRGESYTSRVLLSCCSQKAKDNHTH
jgi:hypothetical protein